MGLAECILARLLSSDKESLPKPTDIVICISNLLSTTNPTEIVARLQALDNLDLEIPEKRVTAFIGPSGCGKSTLARMLEKINSREMIR